MNITNQLTIFCRAMGKEYRITHIAKSDEEANNYTQANPGTSVIAEEQALGLVFIAEDKSFDSKSAYDKSQRQKKTVHPHLSSTAKYTSTTNNAA